jgi:hypothetical protein
MPALPKIRLGRHEVTRLILGSNPFNGYGHFNLVLTHHMLEWFTPENANRTLRMAEQNGINTWQFSHTERGLRDLDRYLDSGGKLQWLVLANRDDIENPAALAALARRGPIGILHHGSVTDERFRAGEKHRIREFVARVRDTGVLAGISTHNPRVIETAEEEAWGADFYMACLYQVSRTPAEVEKMLGRRAPLPPADLYFPDDPPRMFRAIRATPKPCLAFKILAAGRVTDTPEQIDDAFRAAFAGIKPQDAVIVGMWPKFTDQVQENVDRVLRILAPA